MQENAYATNPGREKCGSCHKPQYDSAMATAHHRPGRDEKSQLTGRSPNPFWDKLMMGHGFTKEHNNPRSHASMLVDHLVVDREREIRAFVQQEINHTREHIAFNRAAVIRMNRTVLTRNDSTAYLAFDPFTTTPAQGVHYGFGSDFGQPISPFDYQAPREFSFSFGIRY